MRPRRSKQVLWKLWRKDGRKKGSGMSARKKLTAAERRIIYDKFGGYCVYCGRHIAYKDMQVDHFLPVRGGAERDELGNMLPACRSCNHYKRGNTLEVWRKILEAVTKKIAFYFERENTR